MKDLSSLELAVLEAILLQAPEVADALRRQLDQGRVIARENTGAGFYVTFEVPPHAAIENVPSPLGDVGAAVAGLEHGMGFLLWLSDGRLDALEGYSYQEDTLGLDFELVAFQKVGPRR